MGQYTAADKWQEARREVHMRRRVYGRMLHKGEISVNDARERINIMQEICDDYRAQCEREPPGPLFDEVR